MNENIEPCDPGKVYRESAVTLLERRVTELQSRLNGLQHLLHIAKRLENGSDAEHALWQLLISQRYHEVG